MHDILYANIVGFVMYVVVCARPDIAYVVNVFSKFIWNPRWTHWQTRKWILDYLKGSLLRVLVYVEVLW